jgi:amidase
MLTIKENEFMDEIFYLSASTLARRIQNRELSSEEVIRAHIDRIEKVNPHINAVVQLRAEQALADARSADTALAHGRAHAGPLHGVPFTVKDWIDAAGLPCNGIEPEFRNRIPAVDAAVVARLRSAGAILLGKTNTLADNPVFGRTNNPYNPAYTASYSSSGEAALIAAGGSPLGLGSDSGGSIRLPAQACGVAGLKPTTGRLPLTGHFPFISAINDPRTSMGPMARFVEDLALALPLLIGEDWQDASVIPMPLPDWRSVDLGSLRVAFYTHHDGANPDSVIVETCCQVAHALSALGLHVEEALPPRIEEASQITREYWGRPESTSPSEWETDQNVTLSSLEVEQHLFRWDRFRRALIGFMNSFDIILTPVAEKPATPHGEESGWIPYTLPYSLTGYPCVVVRAGTFEDVLPVGVQVVARPWRDDVALAVAQVIEQEFGGWQPPPNM